jgi:hypothetical protein
VLLAWDGDERNAIAEAIRQHAPTLRQIEQLNEVRQQDFDVLVTDCMATLSPSSFGHAIGPHPAAHLCVFSLARTSIVDRWNDSGVHAVYTQYGHISRTVVRPPSLPAEIEQLVDDNLAPFSRSRDDHDWFQTTGFQTGGDVTSLRFGGIYPFLYTPDRRPLAGLYSRSPASEGWVLPDECPRLDRWIAAAFRRWAMQFDAIPLFGGWWEASDWQTVGEATAARNLEAAQAELRSETERLAGAVSTAQLALEATQRAAASGLRRLLEAKGQPLAEATMNALSVLGFEVADRDAAEPDRPDGRTEDLLLQDPDDDDFDPVVEVKGYDSGAKAGDLAKVMRHLVRALSSGRKPTAVWWVVNQCRLVPPADRDLLFRSEEAMVSEHAAEQTPLVIIDTRELFHIVRRVQNGEIAPETVRSSLRRARGRWRADSPETET